jgi:hypothetical protein
MELPASDIRHPTSGIRLLFSRQAHLFCKAAELSALRLLRCHIKQRLSRTGTDTGRCFSVRTAVTLDHNLAPLIAGDGTKGTGQFTEATPDAAMAVVLYRPRSFIPVHGPGGANTHTEGFFTVPAVDRHRTLPCCLNKDTLSWQDILKKSPEKFF